MRAVLVPVIILVGLVVGLVLFGQQDHDAAPSPELAGIEIPDPPEIYTPPGPEPGSDHPDIAKGYAALEAKDYRRAESFFRPLAEAGNAEAQYLLGSIYQAGLDRPVNFGVSAELYKLAADQGHIKAHFALYAVTRDSNGNLDNIDQALAKRLQSAIHGHPEAIASLGWSLLQGEGVVKDIEKGFRWLYWGAPSQHPNIFIALASGWLSAQHDSSTKKPEIEFSYALYFMYRARLIGDERAEHLVKRVEWLVGEKRAAEIYQLSKRDNETRKISAAFGYEETIGKKPN